VNDDWKGVRGLLGGKGANLAEMAHIGVHGGNPSILASQHTRVAESLQPQAPNSLQSERRKDK